ncbi:MAG: MerR family transcriptional regulator [Rhodanobacteraceae bacterium]|nr:MerR family transcriptional regulator [Rhodanobacteraceae bacterium]
MNDRTELTLEQLAAAADVPLRTARFYIQKGLLPRPHGSTRSAWYDAGHLETLLRIRKWSEAGLSLARIAELLTSGDAMTPPRCVPGAIEVRTHVYLAAGLELVITPDQARLSPEQLRALIRAVLEAHASLSANAPAAPTTEE